MSILQNIKHFTKDKEYKLVWKVTPNSNEAIPVNSFNELLTLFQQEIKDRNIILGIYQRMTEKLSIESYIKLIIIVYHLQLNDYTNIFLESMKQSDKLFEKNIPKILNHSLYQLILSFSRIIDFISNTYSRHYISLLKHNSHFNLIDSERKRVFLEVVDGMLEIMKEFDHINWSEEENYQTPFKFQIMDCLFSVYTHLFYELYHLITLMIGNICLFQQDEFNRIVEILSQFEKIFFSFTSTLSLKSIQYHFTEVPQLEYYSYITLISLLKVKLLFNSQENLMINSNEYNDDENIQRISMSQIIDASTEKKEKEEQYKQLLKQLIAKPFESFPTPTSTPISFYYQNLSHSPSSLTLQQNYHSIRRSQSSVKPKKSSTPMSVLQNQEIIVSSKNINISNNSRSYSTTCVLSTPSNNSNNHCLSSSSSTGIENETSFNCIVEIDCIKPKAIRKVKFDWFEDEDDE